MGNKFTQPTHKQIVESLERELGETARQLNYREEHISFLKMKKNSIRMTGAPTETRRRIENEYQRITKEQTQLIQKYDMIKKNIRSEIRREKMRTFRKNRNQTHFKPITETFA